MHVSIFCEKFSPSRLLVINIIIIIIQVLLFVTLHHIICRLIRRHLLQTGRIRRSNEVSLHVVYATLWVHQVLIFLTLNLDHSHDHPIDHVDRLSLVVLLPVLLSRRLLLHLISG